QVAAVDMHLGADLVFGALLDEDRAQHPRVLLRQTFQDLVHGGFGLGGNECFLNVDIALRALAVVVAERLETRRGAIVLVQDVVADGIDEGAQALGALDALRRAEGPKDAEKSLLRDVVNRTPRAASRAELD